MAEAKSIDQGDKEPSIEEILESIRQIISDDGTSDDADFEDKGAGSLDLSEDEESVGVDVFDANPVAVDLANVSASADDFKDSKSGSLDLSASERVGKSSGFVNDAEEGKIDLSAKEKTFVDTGAGSLDLSGKDKGVVDKGSGSLDLSSKEKAFVDNGAGSLDLSADENEKVAVSDLDLSSKSDQTVSAENSDDEVFELSPDMMVKSVGHEDVKKEDLSNNEVGSAMEENVTKAKDNDSLISETTASATFAELSKLLSTNISVENEDSKRVGKVTLEDMVKELMKPLLKEWLDKNLPHITEKMVQREVEKLSRRAMDR